MTGIFGVRLATTCRSTIGVWVAKRSSLPQAPEKAASISQANETAPTLKQAADCVAGQTGAEPSHSQIVVAAMFSSAIYDPIVLQVPTELQVPATGPA